MVSIVVDRLASRHTLAVRGDLGPIDAVLLDAGGVLMLPDPDAIRRELADLGAEPDDGTCRRAHFAGMHELDRLGHPDWGVVDLVIAEILGVPASHWPDAIHGLERVYVQWPWVPETGAAEALNGLQAAGYGLAVVTNATGSMEQQLADHRICSRDGDAAARVEVVIDSHVVGVEKPDPRIFELALEHIDAPRERCLYVGDTVYFDVTGARAAGLEPVHIDPYGLCPERDHPHAPSLADLAGVLTERRRV